MAKDEIIGVRLEVKHRSRHSLVVSICAFVAACAGLGMALFESAEILVHGLRYGFHGLYLDLVGPDSAGCCKVLSVLIPDTDARHGEYQGLFDLYVQHEESIARYRPGVMWGLFDVAYGTEERLVIRWSRHATPCGNMSHACMEPILQEVAGIFVEVDERAFASMIQGMASHRADYIYREHHWWRAFVSVFKWVFLLIGLVVPFLLFRRYAVTRKWKSLLKGEYACPACRYELAAQDDGVLLCSECGLKCSVGEG